MKLTRCCVMTAAILATGPIAAIAEPLVDQNHTLTINLENDSTRPGSDNYYTSGERIAYTSPTGQVPDYLASFGHAFLGDGQQRFGLELSQTIFTPYHDKLADPPPGDRPYAAILMGTLSLIQDTDSTRTALGFGLGVIGPDALGEQVQNGFHSLIGQGHLAGWDTQLGNQPVVELSADRILRIPTGHIGSLETDVLPAAGLGLGTFRIYGQAGATVRLGQGLDMDFGVPRIHPGLTGTDAYLATSGTTWYVFAGIDGQAVAWDETLDGLPFTSSRHVSRLPLVGEGQMGFAVILGGMRITATEVIQSNEFRSQANGTFLFTSVAISFKF